MTSPRINAARSGQRKYIGKPCKSCGEKEKYVVNAACVACTKKASAEGNRKVKWILEESLASKGGV